MYKIILMVIFTEAIVNLIFYAGPLQKIRKNIIQCTPFLIFEGDHLLECKYCTSFWIGILSSIIFLFLINYLIVLFFIYAIVFHRLSNYVHIVFSIIRDHQFNLRLNRGK